MSARTRRRAVVKCPGCEKPTTDGRPTTTLDTIERGYGTSPSGKTYLKDVPGKAIWHTDCLDDFRRSNAESQSQQRIVHLADMYTAFVIPGVITHDAWMAKVDRNHNTKAEIAAAIEQATGGAR